jgi:signal transduction histidine kinase
VEPVLAALARTIMRINKDRAIDITVATPRGLKFRGETQDLEEMAGNLIDNASKWAKKKVKVTAAAAPYSPEGTRTFFTVTVEDDGPGLPEDKWQEALKRGKRLDETKPGSGLGLSIVSETAAMYGGKVELGRAGLGGLKAMLKLPEIE